MAVVIAASRCKHAVLTGSCALNLYMPPSYAIDTQDIDFFMHYAEGDDVDGALRVFVADVASEFRSVAFRNKYDTTQLLLRVTELWHSGCTTYQLYYGHVHFADVTTVPYKRIVTLLRTFPRTVVTVVPPHGAASPPLHVAVASLEELLHRIVCTVKCVQTVDGFNGMAATINAWRIAKDGKRLQRFYDLFKRRLVAVVPQTWLMDTATPYTHSVPIDDAVCMPVFGRSLYTQVSDAFRVALTNASACFATMESRLIGFGARVSSCSRDVTFLQTHAASKERSRKRLDNALMRTRTRLKKVNEEARTACRQASDAIDSLRMMVLVAQKDAERMHGQIVLHTAKLRDTVNAAVACTSTDVTLTSFENNFVSIAEAVADAELLPFSLFPKHGGGLLPRCAPRNNAPAFIAHGTVYANTMRKMFAHSMVSTIVVTMEMLARSRQSEVEVRVGPGSSASPPTSSPSSSSPPFAIEPGWTDTGEMLGRIATHIRGLKLDDTRRAVPLVSKSGQFSVRILEVEDDGDEAEHGLKSGDLLHSLTGTHVPITSVEHDAVFAMCDSFITVLTTPLLAHACAIGTAVRQACKATDDLHAAVIQLRKPSPTTYEKLAATNVVAQSLRRVSKNGFVD